MSANLDPFPIGSQNSIINDQVKMEEQLGQIQSKITADQSSSGTTSSSEKEASNKTKGVKTSSSTSTSSVTDSGDPYDPQSVAYDPNLASGNTSSQIGKNDEIKQSMVKNLNKFGKVKGPLGG